ncbi:hypothetical protein [Oceanibacterium hippocampi]|uniref:EAL domain protein n=1 Tax=Oceanibacterium hippocampi TaxID=745714 RepID=A0A1Y5RRU5_9PROT|nr:hypothetical protein [Oceanibacterium hippocampi]SLN21233.1 EAL domain protein [Oceanibacterium hippocampi]
MLPNQDSVLEEVTRRLAKAPSGFRAVQVHLARLDPWNCRDHHRRIAAECFDVLKRHRDGQLFHLSNSDIVFICRRPADGELEAVIGHLSKLFADDPLLEHPEQFRTFFNLETNIGAFALIPVKLREENLARGGAVANAIELEPLDPRRLGLLEDQLMGVDLENIVRRQAVCSVDEAGVVKPLFNELYVAIAELARSLMPNVDLAADPWLFRRLTATLDRRMLKLIPKLQSVTSMPTSINVNVSSVITEDFLAFDQVMRSRNEQRMIMEFQPVDVCADYQSFSFACAFLREKQYRVCLDALTSKNLPFLRPGRLGVDMCKLFWSPELEGKTPETLAKDLLGAIQEVGKQRLILARCDGPEAIAFGHTLGLRLFQGRHVDVLLRKHLAEQRVKQAANG